MKKTYGYARVSTREQHLDRQLKALMDAGVEERDIITDKVSGKDLEREGYQSLKNHFLRDGDTLIVKSLDRLSRRKIDIKKELEYFREHHIRIKILDIPTTMVELSDEQDWIFEMINNILIEVLASIAVPFPVSWTVKMKKKQKETQDILSYHTQAAGCSDKARAKASGGRQPIEECGRTGL